MSHADRPLRIACITCYFDPDYVRAVTLRTALGALAATEVLVCKNHDRGLWRYAEITGRLIRLRLTVRPDVYLLTFRGQEILPLVLLLAGRKPVIFDEFLVPLAWSKQEKHRRTPTVLLQQTLSRLAAWPYKRWLARCRWILADTAPHADLSARLSGVPRRHYLPVPVSADEKLFFPQPVLARPSGQPFRLFFCGNMRPLYGLSYVLTAARALRDQPVVFHIVGGNAQAAAEVAAAQAAGASIEYQRWLPYRQFPAAMHAADLCLTQYGNTPQAQRVISGKAYQMLACARPIVLGASQASGMFTDRQDCLLIPQADSAALVTAITWAREHRKELTAIAQSGRQLYEQQFSSRAITDMLRPVLAGLRH